MQTGRAAFEKLIETAMLPRQVAEMVFLAIENEQFYILTDPEWIEVVRLRTDKLLRLENPQSPAATIARLMRLPRTEDKVSN
jgi:hypothetical protein